jgi:tetratricopeptide (TPR) repeat protein
MGLFDSLFGSKDPQYLYEQVLEFIDNKNYAKAIPLLEQIIRIDPNSANCHYVVGHCYSQIGGEEGVVEAVKYFEAAVKLADEHGGLDNNQTGKACFSVGAYYQYKEDYENSIKYLERTTLLYPEQEIPDARLMLSTSYRLKGDYRRSLQLAAECLNEKPLNEQVVNYWKELCEEFLAPNSAERGDCPSLKGGSPEEIIDYWEKSNMRACGNCRHFGYSIVGSPLCHVESTMAIINKLDHSNIKPKEVKPNYCCLSWFERGASASLFGRHICLPLD